jgi:energy-coupling factor transporter ATP-binding protein EcfA2
VIVKSAKDPTVGRGSVWRRWEPHIHTPGTILNDQFGGPQAWDEYLTRIERAAPAVQALGVTDYWTLDRYIDVVAHKDAGRLASVPLIFANVEIRLAIGTSSGTPINAHLLISPDDPEHVVRAQSFLSKLTFNAYGELFCCTREDLMRLGRAHEPGPQTDEHAFLVGATQFKVTASDLSEALKDSSWARENILIAIAAGTNDGTSGIQKDGSLTALRREIERMAHAVFSASPADRAFWLGQGTLSKEQIIQTYDTLKPCLHGSDAHDLERVCAPDLDRLMWIKGDATFESLRQACIEPELRAYIGANPADGALPYKVIDTIELSGAPWCATPRIELNPGLVGIIGARGSGKTALADLIATGAHSPASHNNDRSFLRRAADLLTELQIKLTWGDGAVTSGGPTPAATDDTDGPRVQYLSQQFVERLCSSEGGINDELLAEIERVIFDEHSAEDRAGAATFTELRDMGATRSRLAQQRSRETLSAILDQISEQRRKQAELPALKTRRASAQKTIGDDKKARLALLGSGGGSRTKRLDEILRAIDDRLQQLDATARRNQAVEQLRDFVVDVRERRAQSELVELERRHSDAGLRAEDWPAFKRVFAGDVDAVIDRVDKEARQRLAKLKGESVVELAPTQAYVADDADLSTIPQTTLTKEAERLRKQIGIDQKKADQLTVLDRKIARAESALTYLEEQIGEAEKAKTRIAELTARRKQEYGNVFDALLEEESQLSELYTPLAAKLTDATGTLGKLTFVVRRDVDIERWANAGERLLDLRRAGPFRGQGALIDIARKDLLAAWQTGSSTEVAKAMAKFREQHDEGFLEHAPVQRGEGARFWQWAADISRWLDDTSHISIRYGISYDGVDIEQLSPGTRGIVLLLVYLSVDQSDDRPLIIDQPEENLDPKSIFDELVGRFREVELRRQVIIVTHNANLVVNTDADQIIVATAGAHRRGKLPKISYEAGGLEDPQIRHKVCEILEGGEQAFRDRARRLRVQLPR